VVTLKADVLNVALERGRQGITRKEVAAYGPPINYVERVFASLVEGRHLVRTKWFRDRSRIFVLPMFIESEDFDDD